MMVWTLIGIAAAVGTVWEWVALVRSSLDAPTVEPMPARQLETADAGYVGQAR